MKRLLLAAGVLGVVATLTVWRWTLAPRDLQEPHRAAQSFEPVEVTEPSATADTQPNPSRTATDAADSHSSGRMATTQAWPLYTRLQTANDLFALAASIREAAVAGDAASMWTLGQIFDSCELLAVKYGEADGPDAAREAINLVTAAMPPAAARYHLRQFERCQGFVEHPEQLENAEIWQTLAAEAGHPAAQLRAWVDRRLDADLGAPSLNRVASLIETSQPDALLLAPRLLRLDAGEAEPAASAIHETAWALTACQLGVECGAQSEITRIRCIWATCAPDDDVMTVLQAQVSPYIFEQARTQATLLTRAIQQGRLGDSGLVELRLPAHSGQAELTH